MMSDCDSGTVRQHHQGGVRTGVLRPVNPCDGRTVRVGPGRGPRAPYCPQQAGESENKTREGIHDQIYVLIMEKKVLIIVASSAPGRGLFLYQD